MLKKIYGYDNFKPLQYEIINRVINGNDVCAVLPTGYGKSITFQVPALYKKKPAIVISPLLSLMDDQKMGLAEIGITSCCFNSKVVDKSQMKKEILQNMYQFIYISPEMIMYLEDFLKYLNKTVGLSLVAIDEAHCISSYGYDFRPAYRGLAFLKKILPDVPILAVTATATEEVALDICKVLHLSTRSPMKRSFDRPNLYLEVRRKSPKPEHDIIPIVKSHSDSPIIIYCLTKKEVTKIGEILKVNNITSGMYHAGLPDKVKEKTHSGFLSGKINVVVATIAFGMGINKSNVRVVIHYGSPKNIEGYYQEIGRAGRDGKKSYCYTFFNFRDFQMQEHFISSSPDAAYRDNQRKLLTYINKYMQASQCRRKILLNYFDEPYVGKCNMCDNCCGKRDIKVEIKATKQNVCKESKMIIELLESMKNKLFGIGMYINIIRGSDNNKITSEMKKNEQYGKGKHRSIAWWKELTEYLIHIKFLQQVQINGGRYSFQSVKVTQKGLQWASFSGLGNLFGDIVVDNLNTVPMATTV
jgi:Werner syndrome ATP-dependent helicase